MKRMIRICLVGIIICGTPWLTSWAGVTSSVLSQFNNPDRTALEKLYNIMLPEAQTGNSVANEIAVGTLRALDRDTRYDELYCPKKTNANSDPNIKEWRTQVQKKAEAGDMFFACVLGLMYMNGSGIGQDPSKGLEWLQKAANAQSALGYLLLGMAYEYGGGVPADKRKAAQHYLQAGKLGLARGWTSAGWLQRRYHALDPQGISPGECYEKAMAMNYPRAFYSLGQLYMEGAGVALDKVKGLSLIRQAAKENCPEAREFLANAYIRYGDQPLGWALLQPPAGNKPGEIASESSALMDAFRGNKMDVAKSLVERSSTLYIGDDESTTVMHAAVVYNQLGVLDMALQKGGDLNARNNLGYTPLQLAILLNNTSNRQPVINYLIEKGARLDASAAVLSDNPDLLQKALESDASQANSHDERGMTPLHLAALHRQLKNVELLLKFHANPNARNIFDETLLHTVIYSYYQLKVTNYSSMLSPKPEDAILAIINVLLASGADINARDTVRQSGNFLDSGTPLMAALAVQDIPAAKLLIERGADVKARNSNGKSGLYNAIQRSPDIALIMIERGADVNEPGVLHSAAIRDERVMDALLSHGADIDVKNKEGQTPLEYATKKGKAAAITAVYKKHGLPVPGAIAVAAADATMHSPSDPIIRTIVSLSFNGKQYSEKALTEYMEGGITNYQQMINMPSEHITAGGLLPLHQAVGYDRYEIAKWLILKGANVNARETDDDKYTALFKAVMCSNLRMVKLLLENKANPNEKANGVSPLKQARDKKLTEIEKLLLKYGASE